MDNKGEKMKKQSLGICILLTTIILLSGCMEEVPEEAKMDIPSLDINDLATDLQLNTKIEDMVFSRTYSTPYDTNTWRITDSKNLMMSAIVLNAENKTVLVEHVHIDISLKSKYARLDGWTQDSMDDKLHAGSQPGFWITDIHPYENIFAIEGFSQMLIDGWGWFIAGYGGLSVEQERLTENNLRNRGGVYGNKVQVVYDLLIKDNNEQFYHTRSIIDEFTIEV